MILEVVQIIAILLFAVIFHEYAHGWVAYRCGDATAKLSGRLTLNPLKHIDPIGTIVVPVVLRLMGFYPLGWAKPVPVNFRNLNNPRRDMIWVAAAGPLVNFTLAGICSGLIRLNFLPALNEFLFLAIFINLILAVFNLIPIPPLDGSRILMGILPLELARPYSRLEPFGLIIVIVLLNFGFLNFIGTIVKYLTIQLGVAPLF